jgi:ABC-2 type transport system ATP-binding protein
MRGTGQIFTYTAKRSACLSVVGPLAIISLVEAGVWISLVLALPVPIWLKGVLAGIDVLLLLLLVFGFLLSPLWTRHSLTPDQLFLHYGFDRLAIPRNWLASAQPVRERLPFAYTVRIRKDHEGRRLRATFSDYNLVQLSLKQPQPIKLRRKTVMVESILINVDQLSLFLAALDLPTSTSQPTAHATFCEEQEQQEHSDDSLPVLQSISSTATAGAVALRLHALTRRYGQVTAVKNLSLQVQTGEIYGFLGPNGAGKTTTIKMITGLIAPDSGTIMVDGHDLHKENEAAKAALGYVPDRAILYERLTGREMLVFTALLRGLTRQEAQERSEYLIAQLQLLDYADMLCETYSFGTKRKLALALALLHRPKVLILDEPFNGLDPRSARKLKDLLLDLARQGTAVLLSTHDLATVETLCQRLGVIFQGQLAAEGSLPDLLQGAGTANLEELFLRLTEKQQVEVKN